MKLLIWCIIALTAPLAAQVSNPSIISVASAPSGSCTAGLPNLQVISTGTQYSCQGGTWGAVGGSGGATLPFPGIVYATSANGGTVATGAQVASAISQSPPVAPAVTSTGGHNFFSQSANLSTQTFYGQNLWVQSAISSVTTGVSDPTGGTAGFYVVPTVNGSTPGLEAALYPALNQICSTPPCNISAYFKTGTGLPYQADIYITGVGDNFVNPATCAVGTTATNMTGTATSVGGGWCRFSLVYSGSSAINQAFLLVSSTTGTCCFTRDGTSGVYMFGPQLTQGSTLQTYQATPAAPIHYCVAAYNGSNQTAGCSPWASATNSTSSLSNIDYNTVVTPPVAGASYCKIFRGGYASYGALSVGGNTKIACGSTVVDTGLTSDSSTAPSVSTAGTATIPLPNNTGATNTQNVAAYDGRQQFYQTIKGDSYGTYPGVSIPAGGTIQLFSDGPGSFGTISYIHITVGVAANDIPAVQNSYLSFIGCGNPTTQIAYLGTHFLTWDAPSNSWAQNDQESIQNLASTYGNFTSNRREDINYTNGCTITWTNASSSNALTPFSDIGYKSGFSADPPQRARHWIYNGSVPTSPLSVAAAATANLLPLVNSGGPGELEGMTMAAYNSTSGNNINEGSPIVSADGNTSAIANGQEDFFGGGWNCTNSVPHTNKWGCATSALQSKIGGSGSPNDFLGYRFFTTSPGDNLLWNNSLQVTLPNFSTLSVNYLTEVDYWTSN